MLKLQNYGRGVSAAIPHATYFALLFYAFNELLFFYFTQLQELKEQGEERNSSEDPKIIINCTFICTTKYNIFNNICFHKINKGRVFCLYFKIISLFQKTSKISNYNISFK